MTRARIRANANLPGLARGETVEVELTDRQVKRAASGQISIVETWEEGASAIEERVASLTVPEVIDLVDRGDLTPEEVHVAEAAGKQRRGILDAVAPTESGPGEPPASDEVHAGGDAPEEGSEPAEEH